MYPLISTVVLETLRVLDDLDYLDLKRAGDNDE
jgi:hypothetical protein